jgi:thioester reductase-like protein
MSDSRGDVLLTGGTGFVGMEVLARLIERGDRRVVCLVRAADDTAARARVDGTMRNLFGVVRARRYAGRVDAVAAELTEPALGLRPRQREELASRVSTIIHSAASVSFTLPLEEARAINLEGTRRMLDFAELALEHGGLDRYAHISTAYVAGTHAGNFSEDDLDVGQGFRNSYEQSKCESEQLVHARTSVPWTIMRPSIVVGDRHSGWTAAFNVMYWPLRAFARGLYSAVPADPAAPLDVVSIDYVADAIHALCEMPGGIGETYHLTAGANATTIGEVAELASRYFHRPSPAVLSPADFAIAARDITHTQRAALESSVAYFPYFAIGTTFDDRRARAALDPPGILVSPLRDYLTRLLDFATASRWGKRPIARAVASAEALAA